MSFDPPGYRPDRTYPGLVGHPYPDHSRPLQPFDVIRSFRVTGEQMWDEDVNNANDWLGWYAHRWAHWWRAPYAPYYTPVTQLFIADPNQVGSGNSWVSGGFEDDMIMQTPYVDYPIQPFGGWKITNIADRIVIAYTGSVWRGIASWHFYKDVIEIAMFISEIRRNKVLVTYTVVEPFTIEADGWGCRVRGWPRTGSPPLIVQWNGADVGTAWVSTYSSGVSLVMDIDFAPGDTLSLKAPDANHGLLGVCVTFIGGLL